MMKQDHTLRDGNRDKRRSAIDRALLVMILVAQLVILWRTVVPATRETADEPTQPPPPPTHTRVVKEELSRPLGFVRQAPSGQDHMVLPPPGILFENHMERMMADALEQFEQIERLLAADTPWTALPPSPTMEMRDQGDGYVVLFSLPGVDPSRIRVTLDGRLLTVASRTGHGGPGIFERRVWLPGPVRPDDYATAVLTNGILRVTIPKDVGPRVEAHPPGPA